MESAKSIVDLDAVGGQHPGQVVPDTAEHLGGQERPPQEDMGEAVPGVADAAVHLNGGLADRAGGAGAQ